MKTSPLTLVLGSLSLLALICQSSSIENRDIPLLSECKSNEVTLSSNVSIEPSRNEVISTFINFEKYKIDHFIKVMHYDLISTGVWDELIRINSLPGVKYLLESYFVGEDVRQESFRYAIVHGATHIAKFMLENYKDIVKPESEMEQTLLVKLACEKKQYSTVAVLLKDGFNANYILPFNQGRSLLHDAVISGDLALVKSLIRYNNNLGCNDIDELGNIPLHYATENEMFMALMFRSDPFIKNFEGINAIFSSKPELSKRFEFFQFHFSSTENYFGFKLFRINRKSVLEDSFHIVSTVPEFYHINFAYEIKFKSEIGYDDGGLTREWLSLLMERFFVSELGGEPVSDGFYGSAPFECIDTANKLYRISLAFNGSPEVYKFIGAVMARALLMKVPLKVKLAPSLIKMIFGKTLTYQDLNDDDPIMYKSILKGIEDGFDFIGTEGVEDLNVFLNETAVNTMYSRYKDQIDLFLEGFHSIFSIEMINAFFTPLEFQEILCGSEEIDRADLYKNIKFCGNYWKENEEMFRAGMDLLTEKELFELVRFVTAINGLPYGGVSSLGKKIKVFDQEPGKLIRSSTCDYILMLPTIIRSAEELAEVLRFAIACGPEFDEGGPDSEDDSDD